MGKLKLLLTLLLCIYFSVNGIYAQENATVKDTVTLKAVTVVGNKKSTRLTSDRLVYDMSSNPLPQNSILQAFKYIPSLKSDGELFSIIGKERTVVYINGRKSRFTAGALAAYLNSLPANSVKSIEVIVTPNTTFEGEGDFGIINIVLKKDEQDGLKGFISGRIRKTYYFKENANLNLNFKKKKLQGNFTSGIDLNSDWQRRNVESLYKESLLTTSNSSVTIGNNKSLSAALILEYELTPKTTLGVFANFSFYKENHNEIGYSIFSMDNSSKTDSTITLDYNSRIFKPQTAENVNIRTILNNKSSLNIDLDYFNHYNRYKSTKTQNITIDNLTKQNHDNFVQLSPQKVNIGSVKIDYSYKDTTFLLNAGVDGYYSNVNNNDQYFNYSNNDYELDKTLSNLFILKELNVGAFVNTRYKLSNKFSIDLGIRLERTNYKGEQRTLNTDFTYNYWNILPILLMNYMTNSYGTFNYSLSHRISRAPFDALNPFIVYNSPSSYAKGNPYLNPVKLYMQSLSWKYKQLYVNLSYQMQKDIISGVQVIKDNNMIESMPMNLNKQHKLSTLISTDIKYLNKKATLNLSVNYNWINFNGQVDNIDLSYKFNSVNINLNNYLVLSKRCNWGLEVGLQYYSKEKYNNRYFPSNSRGSLELYKSFKYFQLSLFGFQNLYFYNGHVNSTWKTTYDVSNLLSTTYQRGEAAGIGIRIRYNFGNRKVKNLDIRETSNSEVKQRLTNY